MSIHNYSGRDNQPTAASLEYSITVIEGTTKTSPIFKWTNKCEVL